jgi:lipopolysaccharide cholinephosphotransferase
MNVKLIQKHLIVKLTLVSELCVKHDVPYYLIGGSLLGAVRHKGFIPWDDDVDVGILRHDYEFFTKLLKSKNQKLYFDSYETNPHYVNNYLKILAKDVEVDYKWNNNVNYKTYASVDIFPLDGSPDNFVFRIIYVWYVQALISFKNYLYLNSSPRPFLSRIIADLFKKIFKIKPFVLLKFIDNQMKRFPVNSSKYLVNYSGIYGFREIVKREVLGLPSPYDFENQVFYGVENYDLYLTKIYGDYLLIPEEKKRYSHYS